MSSLVQEREVFLRQPAPHPVQAATGLLKLPELGHWKNPKNASENPLRAAAVGASPQATQRRPVCEHLRHRHWSQPTKDLVALEYVLVSALIRGHVPCV